MCRNLQEGTLKVDGGKPIVQRSPGKLRQLNTDAGLYVGGMPDPLYYTRNRYVQVFSHAFDTSAPLIAAALFDIHIKYHNL